MDDALESTEISLELLVLEDDDRPTSWSVDFHIHWNIYSRLLWNIARV